MPTKAKIPRKQITSNKGTIKNQAMSVSDPPAGLYLPKIARSFMPKRDSCVEKSVTEGTVLPSPNNRGRK